MSQLAVPTRQPFGPLRERIDAALTAEMIATPRDALVCAEEDEVEAVTRQMEEGPRYDILPVDAEVTRLWIQPRALLDGRAAGPFTRPLVPTDLVASSTPILEVLRLMAEQQRGFYFVLRDATLAGLITYSDLNKRSVRTALFALVNELEEVLIERLEDQHLSDESIKTALRRCDAKDPDGDWKRIHRAWRAAQSAGVELDEPRYATLDQITRLVKATMPANDRLTERLGADWELSMQSVRRVRNKVAHPGQLLIASVQDVVPLWASCAFAY